MRPPCAASNRPIVPSTSGCPAWPIRITSRPSRAYLPTSMCTLVTSGQVASNTASPRRAASFSTRRRHAVRAEDDGRAVRHCVELVDEHGAEAAQAIDDEPVVHDLVAHVDRRAEELDRALDDVDRAVDAGAESARIGEEDLHPAAALLRRLESSASMISMTAPVVIADVGDVEGREEVLAPVEMQVVHDVAVHEAVDRHCRARRRGSARARSRASCWPRAGSERSHHRIASAIAPASTRKNQRCQPPASARSLNAAPVLCRRVRSRNGPTGRISYSSKRPTTYHFVSWSSATTNAESQTQTSAVVFVNERLRHAKRLVSPGPSRFADAAAADLRVLGSCADVGAPVPAAHALRRRIARRREIQAPSFATRLGRDRRRRPLRRAAASSPAR